MSPRLNSAEQGKGFMCAKVYSRALLMLFPGQRSVKYMIAYFVSYCLLPYDTDVGGDSLIYRGSSHESSKVQCQYRICLSPKFQNPPEFVTTESSPTESKLLTIAFRCIYQTRYRKAGPGREPCEM